MSEDGKAEDRNQHHYKLKNKPAEIPVNKNYLNTDFEKEI